MAQGKTTDALLALYEFVCGEPPRLSHALDRDATWQKILVRLIGRVEQRLLSLSVDAYGRGMSHRSFDEWLRREALPVVDAYGEDAQAEDVVGATQRFFSRLQNLDLPEHFRGRYKRPRPSSLPAGDLLLKEFDELVEQYRRSVRPASDRLMALMSTFTDVDPEILGKIHDQPGKSSAERSAKLLLAARYQHPSQRSSALSPAART